NRQVSSSREPVAIALPRSLGVPRNSRYWTGQPPAGFDASISLIAGRGAGPPAATIQEMPSSRLDRISRIFDEIARGPNLDRALSLISTQVAAELGAPTCKIWVVKRGDICERCSLASICTNREICMHLAAVSGAAREKEYPRIPLSAFNAAMISR